MRPLVLRGFVRQQLQEHLMHFWIGGFGKPLAKELEAFFVDKIFHGLPSGEGSTEGLMPDEGTAQPQP